MAGAYGYTMVVYCSASTDEEAIDMAFKARLFSCRMDAKIAFAEEADDYTVNHFKKYGLIHEL